MAGGNAIRGSRVGAGPMGETERGDSAPRIFVSYWCANGHETRPSFAEEQGLQIPELWDCPRCGFPAGQNKEEPPAPPKNEPYKTHLAYVKERRSDADGEALLTEALEALRNRRRPAAAPAEKSETKSTKAPTKTAAAKKSSSQKSTAKAASKK